MSGRAHSRATKLAATFLARESGADAAAEAFGIDPRTIRQWLKTVELPLNSWEAIRDVLLARGSELTAKGETKNLVATLTAAGISSRNVRYGQLIARGEARREAEEEAKPDPAQEVVNRLPDDRQRWLRDYLDCLIELDTIREVNGDTDTMHARMRELPLPSEEGNRAMADHITEHLQETAQAIDLVEWIRDATTEQLEEAVAAVGRKAAEQLTGWTAHYATQYGQRVKLYVDRSGQEHQGRHPELLYSSVPVLVDKGDGLDVTPPRRLETSEPPPPPPVAPEKPAEPVLVDVDDRPWLWHRIEG